MDISEKQILANRRLNMHCRKIFLNTKFIELKISYKLVSIPFLDWRLSLREKWQNIKNGRKSWATAWPKMPKKSTSPISMIFGRNVVMGPLNVQINFQLHSSCLSVSIWLMKCAQNCPFRV